MDGDASILPFKPDPRPFAALFGWIFGHVFVLLKDRMDTVGGDRETISNTEDVSNGLCTSAEALAQFEDALFEIGWILGVGLTSGRFEVWNLAAVAVFLGELLDPSASDLKSLLCRLAEYVDGDAIDKAVDGCLNKIQGAKKPEGASGLLQALLGQAAEFRQPRLH
ncbi:hypothetical protein C448_11996 [Halococcus morrhuae DSM 1307]|uniref:Uncharacterized protein n=1 Tax=Halococcus morrhuae DSM 1307 TaxID=931277 RepID=M0M6M9_HALMO|nr:hypothetical protein C448_11996 [Halococcus morrhuae DSM 1307]